MQPLESFITHTKPGPIQPQLSPLKLVLRWHGIKTLQAPKGFRMIPQADLYIDARGIAEKGIAGTTGLDSSFQEGVKKASAKSLDAILTYIVDGLRHVTARRSHLKDPFSEPYTIYFMCAHGVHRSVASANIIYERLKAMGYDVTIDGGSTSKLNGWMPNGTKE